MARDKEKDDRVENAVTPRNVYCDSCSNEMNMTMKHLSSNDTRVMFWFECPNKCKKRKAVFDNGEEFKPEPPLCPRCSGKLNEKLERKGEALITYISCPNCKYKNKEIIDYEKDRKEWAEKKRKDKELLKKYRWQFCLNEKEGQEYISHIESMKRLREVMEESEKKQKDPTYKKVQKLKRLKITDLRENLEKILTKERYLNLKLDKPQMDRYVIVPFTLEDGDSKRGEYDSRNNCRKIIKETLEKTNWRLISEGISYRLGYLSGNLKGYEQEEDLAELIRKENKSKPNIHKPDDFEL
ncbi:MAG: hypothetical protein QY322_02195 [bacterium]|nr:MAG: hypothetical protein QY322_02195 [bacterium]